MSPREKPSLKSNNFLKIESSRLAESVDGLNNYLPIVSGKL